MSFLYNSVFENIFTGDSEETTGPSASFTSRFLSLAGFSSLVTNRREWQSNILFQMKRSSDGALCKLHDIWSIVQESSSVMHSSSAWKTIIIDEFCSSQLYADTSEWLSSTIEKVPYLHKLFEQIIHAEIANDGILEDLNSFTDYSDVIRDFIKSFKVLVTFDSVANVQEDLFGSNFNVQNIVQEKRRCTRYIG